MLVLFTCFVYTLVSTHNYMQVIVLLVSFTYME